MGTYAGLGPMEDVKARVFQKAGKFVKIIASGA